MKALPARSTPIIYADVNDGPEISEDDDVVGDYPYGNSSAEAGRSFRNLLADYDMNIMNTHFGTGLIYWGLTGTTSRIDFLGIPLAALPRARTCSVNFGIGRTLQQIITKRFADHYPFHLDLLLKDRYDKQHTKGIDE